MKNEVSSHQCKVFRCYAMLLYSNLRRSFVDHFPFIVSYAPDSQ